MGIRFHCPNGHKLNVKSFLAGRRGICPDCGVRFRIPQESGGVAELATKREKAAHLSGSAPTEGLTAPSSLLDDLLASWDDVQASDETTDATAALPAAAQLPQVPMAEPLPAGADPLVEAPDAVWYVRPRSGGQFGPAAADVMNKWIAEGRVASDSLVWRDGWPEWKPASDVFGQLGGGGHVSTPSPPPALAAPLFPVNIETEPTSSGTANVPGGGPARPRKSNGPTIVIVVTLTVLALVLLAVFAFVVSGGSSP